MKDRRIGISPKPAVPGQYLNEQQLHGLYQLNQVGWKLFCVRRQSDSPATVLLKNSLKKKIGILGEDGKLTRNIHINIRHHSR